MQKQSSRGKRSDGQGPPFAFNQKDFRPQSRKSCWACCKIFILQHALFCSQGEIVMEIKVNREIRNYNEAIFLGLSMRQLIYSGSLG